MQEEKRFKIAEACGWIPYPTIKGAFSHLKHEGIFAAPDYFNDLNSMHDAEKILTMEQHCQFREHLAKLVNFNGLTPRGAREYISSNATQRAEAFGKTLNLW